VTGAFNNRRADAVSKYLRTLEATDAFAERQRHLRQLRDELCEELLRIDIEQGAHDRDTDATRGAHAQPHAPQFDPAEVVGRQSRNANITRTIVIEEPALYKHNRCELIQSLRVRNTLPLQEHYNAEKTFFTYPSRETALYFIGYMRALPEAASICRGTPFEERQKLWSFYQHEMQIFRAQVRLGRSPAVYDSVREAHDTAVNYISRQLKSLLADELERLREKADRHKHSEHSEHDELR
jgi:hypothetical protein